MEMINQINEAEKYKKEALDYLKSKYNDEFYPVSFYDRNSVNDFFVVKFKCEKYSDGEVKVRIYSNDDVPVFSDNYFRLYMKSDSDKFISDIIKSFIDDFSVDSKFYSIELPAFENNDNSFSAYLKSGYCVEDVAVYHTGKISENSISDIVADLAKSGLKGNIRFIQLKNLNDVSESLLSAFTGESENVSEVINRIISA